METIYVIIKVAVAKDGPDVAITTEKAFRDQNQAIAYFKTVPALWEESLNGIEFSAERAVHQVVLE